MVSVQVSVSLAKKPGDSGYEIGDDRKTRQRTIRKVMVGVAKSKSKNSSNRKSFQKNYAK